VKYQPRCGEKIIPLLDEVAARCRDGLVGRDARVRKPRIDGVDGPTTPSTSSFVNPFVIKCAPMPVAPADYEWRLLVDGEARENWRLPFHVHPPQQG